MGKVQRISDLVTSHYLSKKDLVTSHYSSKRNKRLYSAEEARSKADYLASKLHNQSRWMFYLKCAWNLDDVYLDRLLSIALTKDNAQRYFSAAAANEMRQNA